MKLFFSQTFGQLKAKAFIESSFQKGGFPQAVLIHGEPGLGQFSLLMDLAAVLICQDTASRPCGVCSRCIEQKSQKRDNRILVFPLNEKFQKTTSSQIDETINKWRQLEQDPYTFDISTREHISISQVRELKNRLGYSEKKSITRVILMFGVETMQEPAANALLKILEEPPPNTHFLLCSHHKAGLLPTILSRCIQIPLVQLTIEESQRFADARPTLKEMGPEALAQCVAISGGSPRSLLYLASQEGRERLHVALEFLQIVSTMKSSTFSELLTSQSCYKSAEDTLAVLSLCLQIIKVTHRQFFGETSVIKTLAGGLSLETLYPLVSSHLKCDFLIHFIQDTITAIKRFSKPDIALLGGFFHLQKNIAGTR